MPNRKREGENLKQAGEAALSGATETAHKAISRGRGVAFLFIYSPNSHRNFGAGMIEICHAPAKFASRPVIVGRRILNVSERVRCKNETDEPDQQIAFS